VKVTDNGWQVLDRLDPRERGQGRIAVLDIETWGLNATTGAFALGVVYDGQKFYHFTNVDDMRNWLLTRYHRGWRFYAHNGFGYDYLAIFGNLFHFFNQDSGHIIIENAGKFYACKYLIRQRVNKNGKRCNEYVGFYDSYNILPVSVEEMGEALGYPKSQTPEKFKTGERSEITDEDWQYCERDCEIVYKMLKDFFSKYGNGLTIAGIAMKFFRRHFLRKPIFVKPELDYMFREAYYGGRVECYDLAYHDQASYYDINSLYPFAMSKMTPPNPATLRREENISVARLENLMVEYEGMAKVEVECKMELPILPYRRKGKLVFPNGKFTTCVCFPELRLFVQHGGKITKVHYVIYGKRMINHDLSRYAITLYSARQEAKKNNDKVNSLLIKLLLNSLYGKFGEVRDTESVYVEHEHTQVAQKLWAEGWIFEPLGYERQDGYMKKLNSDIKDIKTQHTIFCFCAYVTSVARCINWEYQHQLRVNGYNVLYTDTDSFIIDGKPDIETSTNLGDVKLEGIACFQAYGKKDYVFGNDVKLKGAGKKAKQVSENVYLVNRVVKTREAIKNNLTPGQPLVVEKVMKRQYDSGVILDSKKVEPLWVDEERERELAEINKELKEKQIATEVLGKRAKDYKNRNFIEQAIKRQMEELGMDSEALYDPALTFEENDLDEKWKWEKTLYLDDGRRDS